MTVHSQTSCRFTFTNNRHWPYDSQRAWGCGINKAYRVLGAAICAELIRSDKIRISLLLYFYCGWRFNNDKSCGEYPYFTFRLKNLSIFLKYIQLTPGMKWNISTWFQVAHAVYVFRGSLLKSLYLVISKLSKIFTGKLTHIRSVIEYGIWKCFFNDTWQSMTCTAGRIYKRENIVPDFGIIRLFHEIPEYRNW